MEFRNDSFEPTLVVWVILGTTWPPRALPPPSAAPSRPRRPHLVAVWLLCEVVVGMSARWCPAPCRPRRPLRLSNLGLML
jgi:hypothetical protein